MRQRRSRRFLSLAFLWSLAVVVFSCAPAAAPAGKKDEAPIVVTQGADPNSMDPIRDTSTYTLNVFENVYDTLVSMDGSMKLQPRLATAWRQTSSTEWIFDLRKGVRFQDGTPWNAEAAKFTIDRIKDVANKAVNAAQITSIASASVVDDSTLKVTTKYPMTPLPYQAFITTYFASPTAVRQMGDQQFGLKGVGTGPYRMSEWVKDDHLTLEANPDYWGTKPTVKTLIFRPIKEISAAVAALKTGKADVVLGLAPSQVPTLGQGSGVKVESVDGVFQMHFVINTAIKPLNDARVRQALNYAVDKETIVKNLLGGYASITCCVINKRLLGYDPSLAAYPYDPTKAKQLLADAGYATGFSVDLAVTQGRYVMDKEIAEAVAEQLGKVGVRVKVNVVDASLFLGQVRELKFGGLAYLTVAALRGDPDHSYSSDVYSKGTFPGLYNNATMDQLIEAGRQAAPAERTKIYRDAEALARSDPPWLFMFSLTDLVGISDRVKWSPKTHGFIRGVEMGYTN